MDKADIPFLSASDLSRLIETKEVSPLEATEAYLDRIDDLDFKFNAYLTVCRTQALQAAQQAEDAIVRGNYLGPMHGIPVAVKDQMWTKGIRTTDGSRMLMDFVPDEDATAVANLKKAGAILLGKTNQPEFALGGGVERFSRPRNPWDLDKSAGASSGGSAAATAAFLCSSSLGEDTGGSIRSPASWCGLVGMKPTWGMVSRYGLIRGVWSMDMIGPLSRTVEDAAITLSAIAGYDPKDPYTWDVPVPDYREAALNGDMKGIRVGVMKESFDSDGMEEKVKGAALKAATALGELGAVVGEVSIPLSKYMAEIASLQSAEIALDHREWLKGRLQDYGHNVRISLLVGGILPAQAYYKGQKLRTLLARQVQEAFVKYDVLVSPTMRRPAPTVMDEDAVFTSKESASLPPHSLTRVFSLAFCPAITVPCGFTSEGLPIGLQIGGRTAEDATVFKVARAYEQHTPWHTMKPPNS